MVINQKSVIVFLGAEYNSLTPWAEQYLPIHLSRYAKVLCFEYPRFTTLYKIFVGKVPLIEKKSNKLIIYHSFGIIPFGRKFLLLNFLNHFINLLFLKMFFKRYLTNTTIITFTPEYIFASSLFKNCSVFYHVLDEYTSLPWWNSTLQKSQFKILEKMIIKIAKKIIVVSSTLYKKYSQFHKNVYCYPTPTRTKLFLNSNNKVVKCLDDMNRLSKPILGFIGTINDWKLDIDLLTKVIKKYTDISFVFIGQINKRSNHFNMLLNRASNIYYLGYKPLQLLPYYLSRFDVCIIPYKTNKYGESAYPIKIMEYLALGKPIVTTGLPSIKYLADRNLIYWARNSNEFKNYIRLALSEPKNTLIIKQRIDEAKKNDWEIRIREYLKIIDYEEET